MLRKGVYLIRTLDKNIPVLMLKCYGDTVSVGKVSTGKPWTNATIRNNSTTVDTVLDFTISRGDKGDKWPMGTLENGGTVPIKTGGTGATTARAATYHELI